MHDRLLAAFDDEFADHFAGLYLRDLKFHHAADDLAFVANGIRSSGVIDASRTKIRPFVKTIRLEKTLLVDS